ncbi:MAG: hypothetical protein PHF97_02075 [Bacteroidales bacterium]|nr:hypothetical protein [Bacteroidales bacterium]MDD4602579.1 hypothetical protein [Bacteroidales bacterium]
MMNKEIIQGEVRWLLEAINEQYEVIRKYDGKIPNIEFDLLRENVRKFYENLLLLKRINNEPGPLVEKPTTIHPETPPAKVAPLSASEPETKKSPPIPEVKVHIEKKKSSKPPEIDLFAAEEPVFNIKLKEAREISLGPKIPTQRIDNLKSAININDKFMFINELFDGNLREYNATIETINGCKDISEASEFLNQLLKKNFWDTGTKAFKKLMELIERRF